MECSGWVPLFLIKGDELEKMKLCKTYISEIVLSLKDVMKTYR